MKNLLLLAVLFASCVPQKTYTTPEIGMHSADFNRLCGGALYDDHKTVTNSQGYTETITMKEATEFNGKVRPAMCIGTFTFVNFKLETITH